VSHYLITGGAGFIGSHLVDALLAAGQQVRVLDDFSSGRPENLAAARARFDGTLEVMRGDVRDMDAVNVAMAGAGYVVHLAAMVSVRQSVADPLGAHAVNASGTLHVLEAARAAGVQRAVVASSCAVYGDNEDLPLSEGVPPRPLSPYAASKVAAEAYCQAYSQAYGLPTTCLRFFNVYGPRQNPDGDYAAVIPKFVQRMRAGQPPIILGDEDVVQACLLACRGSRAGAEVLNVASGRAVSLLELVETLNTLLGRRLAPEFQAARPGEVRHSAGDAARLCATLGCRVETSLAEGLRSVIA
jgi:UDP-glucose 4-epimerase